MKLFDNAPCARLCQWWQALQKKAVEGQRPKPIVVDEAESHKCKNCGTEYRGNYCPGCGQSSHTPRLSGRTAVESMAGVIMAADRGFLHTCIDLTLRPGYMMRDYVMGRRVQYLGPVNLLFLLSTVYVLLRYLLFPGVDVLDLPDIDPAADGVGGMDAVALQQFMNDVLAAIYGNRALATLFECAVSAVPYWLMFRSLMSEGRRVSIWEFFYISCYMSSQRLMWYLLCLPWERLSHTAPQESLVVPLLLTLVDMRQYFMQPWRKVVPRSLAAFFLSIVFATALILTILFVAAMILV